MRTSRRALLQLGGAMLASSAVARLARADTAKRSTPRYLVQIVLFGGIDAVLTTDPKEKSEVDPGIDVPYAPQEIVTAGDLRFGPHLAPLSKWSSKMSVLNSVFVGTANHPAGATQISRLRLGASEAMPMAMDIIGSRRDTQALGSVALGMGPLTYNGVAAPQTMDPSVFKAIDAASPEELTLLAGVMRRQAKELARGATRDNLESSATFFERIGRLPRFTLDTKWPSLKDMDDGQMQMFAQDLQRTLWLFENDLARCTFSATGNWDSHAVNLSMQGNNSRSFLPIVSDFIGELQNRKNRHGNLLDNTLIVMSSELGRYPVLNGLKGKDHFPELPMMFIGAGIGTGKSFGRSGRRMEGLRISKKTGKEAGGLQGSPTLTDVGATVLRLFGIDPDKCGYTGDTLEFLGVG